jgi:hypothetical protein
VGVEEMTNHRDQFRPFKEFVHSIKHESDDSGGEDDDMFPNSSSAVEGIPVDICEKLRYVHIYY